jgi:hypothetical protein
MTAVVAATLSAPDKVSTNDIEYVIAWSMFPPWFANKPLACLRNGFVIFSILYG